MILSLNVYHDKSNVKTLKHLFFLFYFVIKYFTNVAYCHFFIYKVAQVHHNPGNHTGMVNDNVNNLGVVCFKLFKD